MHKLIIPDVHQNIDRLNSILRTKDAEEAQEIIFLGDYFDSFDYDFYTPEMCDILNKNIDNDRYTFLIGNHDAHYLSGVSQYLLDSQKYTSSIAPPISDYDMVYNELTEYLQVLEDNISNLESSSQYEFIKISFFILFLFYLRLHVYYTIPL